MLKRFCTNPTPENGGQFCAGAYVKFEPCQDVCPGKVSFDGIYSVCTCTVTFVCIILPRKMLIKLMIYMYFQFSIK